MPSSKIITVYGATGAQGGSVARSLIQNKDLSVRGITRNTDSHKSKALAALGVEMVQADGLVKGQILEAFRGSQGVFVNTNPDDPTMKKPGSPSEVEMAKELIDAAVEAGVQHFVYSGLVSASKVTHGAFPNRDFDDKHAIGEYAKTKNFKSVTIVSMGWYLENHFLKELAAVTGGFPYLPGDDGVLTLKMPQWGGRNEVPFIGMAADCGDIVHGIFLAPEEYNRRFVQAFSQLATPDQMVEAFTKGTGKKARYQQMDSWESFEIHDYSELDPIKRMFGFLDHSDGNYYGEPYNLTASKELKAKAVRAKGLSDEEADLMTLERFFAKHF